MTLTVAEEIGVRPVGPGGAHVHVYRLAVGHAYCMTNGEWRLTQVIKPDVRSVEYAYKIIWVQGRACAVFQIYGEDRWAQPINGNVAPGVARAEKARAKAARASAPPAAPAPAPAAPAGPSKAALRLAAMRARRERGA